MMTLTGRLRQVTDMMLAAAGLKTMITCAQALAVMQEFLDGELPRSEDDKVRAHFEVCRRCYPQLRAEESFRSAIKRAAEGLEAPPGLKVLVRDLLARESRG